MRRRVFLSLFGASATQRAFTARPSHPPNFVVVLCDDLGYGDLSCYGHPVIRTPRLDGFAKQGLLFTDFYAAAPVCSPSRAGLLTGRTPNRAGIYNWIPSNHPMHLRRGEATIAALLQQAGYNTCLSGKWHLNGRFNSPAQPQPSDHGFRHWFATQNNAAPTHMNPHNFVRNGRDVGPLEGHSSALIVDEAINWLGAFDSGREPFFLYVAFHSPHEPVASSPRFLDAYASESNADRRQYFANVTETDFHFGRLIDSLHQRGLDDNTFLLFTSDNGPETLLRYKGSNRSYGSARPLRSMKLSLYEGGYRVPGMLRFPARLRRTGVSKDPICTLDLLPTLCDLVGVARPKNRVIDGSSWSPLFVNRPVERRTPLHWHYFNALDAPRSSMREGDWKILGIPDSPPATAPGGAYRIPADNEYIKSLTFSRYELYNLARDTSETTDLSASEPQRLKRMADLLNRLHEQVRQEGPAWT